MRCNKKGQMAGYEALIIIVLLGTTGWVFYLYANKPSDSSIYQSGSKPFVQQPEYTSHFGCNNVKVDNYTEGLRNEYLNKTLH